MTLKARVIPCLDVKDSPRRPQPRSGEDAQNKKNGGRPLTLKARVIPCLDVKDGPRRPQLRSGEDAQNKKMEAVL